MDTELNIEQVEIPELFTVADIRPLINDVLTTADAIKKPKKKQKNGTSTSSDKSISNQKAPKKRKINVSKPTNVSECVGVKKRCDEPSKTDNLPYTSDDTDQETRRSGRKLKPNTKYKLDSDSGDDSEIFNYESDISDEYVPPTNMTPTLPQVAKKRMTQVISKNKSKQKSDKESSFTSYSTLNDQLKAKALLPDMVGYNLGTKKNDTMSKSNINILRMATPKKAESGTQLMDLIQPRITSVTSVPTVDIQNLGSDITMKKIQTTPKYLTNNPTLSEDESYDACKIIRDILKSTGGIGNLITSKSAELISKKITPEFITNTDNLKYCVDKALMLFKLAREGLTERETTLRTNHEMFLKENGYSIPNQVIENLTCVDNVETKSCPQIKLVDSDSDCEIIEDDYDEPLREIEAPYAKSLDETTIRKIKQIERSGSISLKKTGSNFINSNGQQIQLPGNSAVFISSNIQVKKISTQKNQQFFCKDGRTLKPPDRDPLHLSTILSDVVPKNVKILSKRTLIQGWLNIAHKHFENNFYKIIKDLEKKKKFSSCSDLGDSCSDGEFETDTIENRNETNVRTNDLHLCSETLDNLQNNYHPASLITLCIREINKSIYNFDSKDLSEIKLPSDEISELSVSIPKDRLVNFTETETIVSHLQDNVDHARKTSSENMKEINILNENISLAHEFFQPVPDLVDKEKLQLALADLLRSSSDSENIHSFKINLTKRKYAKLKVNQLDESEISDESLSSSRKSGKSVNGKIYDHLKNDQNPYSNCYVKLDHLNKDTLNPFLKCKEFNQDYEIDKLVDLSTLKYSNTPTSQISNIKKHVEANAPSLTMGISDNLLSLVTTHGIELKSESACADKESEDAIFLAAELKHKTNLLAKNILAGSSSNESDAILDISDVEGKSVSDRSTKLSSKKETSPADSKKNTTEPKSRDVLLSNIPSLSKKHKRKNVSKEELKRRWEIKKDKINALQNSENSESTQSSNHTSNETLTSVYSENKNDDRDFSDTSSGYDRTGTSSDPESSSESKRSPDRKAFKDRDALNNVYASSSEDDAEKTVTPSKYISSGSSILDTPSKGRKNIRNLITDDHLTITTKEAAKEEEDRLRRLNQKQSQITELLSQDSSNLELQNSILDFDLEKKKPTLTIHPQLVKIMKDHQIEGVKFMWDTCFESVNTVKEGKAGGGCILAHCMGLGKTLQVVALVYALLTNENVPIRTVLICCPLSTVLNWVYEFHKWMKKITNSQAIKVLDLSKLKKNHERAFQLEDWHEKGGVFVLGYEMFRHINTLKSKKAHVMKSTLNKISRALLDPGPDVVVCDEGHLLKNDNTSLAKMINRIRTRRRIVLTGTPLQNNLKEYYCMVNFVKPNLLGTQKEYFNRFENPITNGQHRDSSLRDISIMKKRSHVLHKMLEGCVQRKEVSILYPYLPRKQEYVLLITLTECQIDLYKYYLENHARSLNKNKGASLLTDFQVLQKIWTHPRILHKFMMRSRERLSQTAESIIDPQPSTSNAENDASIRDSSWWLSFIPSPYILEMHTESHKFAVTFNILEECLLIGEKMLIFCTSLFTLDTFEYFLGKMKNWKLGRQYYRLDGSVSLENRQKWCKNFNSEQNNTVKLFLISTRAGGLGINMVGANRIVIMDVSWNPSHDIQSIFRIYRFGQKKDCFIYRLVALGTMEEKMYERSVTKQAIACRVVDEQQIDRHYNLGELNELYGFEPLPFGSRPIPNLPSDPVLASVLAKDRCHGDKVPLVWSVHEHDSLLKDLHDEQLDEDERQAAWLEYEAEKTSINNIPLAAFKNYYPTPVFPVSLVLKHQIQNSSDSHSILPDSVVIDNEQQQINTKSMQQMAQLKTHYQPIRFNNRMPTTSKPIDKPNINNSRMFGNSGIFTKYPTIESAKTPSYPLRNAFQNVQITNVKSQNPIKTYLPNSRKFNSTTKRPRLEKISEESSHGSLSTANDPIIILETPEKKKYVNKKRRSYSGKVLSPKNFASGQCTSQSLSVKRLNFVDCNINSTPLAKTNEFGFSTCNEIVIENSMDSIIDLD